MTGLEPMQATSARNPLRDLAQRAQNLPDQLLRGEALRRQLLRFGTIGVGSTVLHLGMLAVLAAPLGAQVANAVALLVATLANTAVNRAWTFGVRGAEALGRHHMQALVVFAITWVATSGALALVAISWPHPPTTVTVLAVGVANVLSTVARFAAMRGWIFRRATMRASSPDA